MTDKGPRHDPWSRWRWPLTVLAIVFVVGGLAGAVLQVEVTSDEVSATRACGTPLDVIVDRSGWETWWARDLDEPDQAVRDQLVRTSRCPDAINQRIVISSTMVIAGVVVAVVALARAGRTAPSEPESSTDGRRLRRGGAATAIIGAVLTGAGLVAVIVLIADADATLFLYTDRLVVALAGVIVLVPAIALIIGGWAIHLVGRRLDRRGHDG